MYDPYAKVAVELVADQGERLLRSWQEITGVRQTTCPWQAMRDPFVGAVLDAHYRAKGGSIVAANPGLSRVLFEGVEIYERALQAVTAHDMRVEAEKRENEDKTPTSVPGSFGSVARSPRMSRRSFR